MRLYIKADTDNSLAFDPDANNRYNVAVSTDDVDLLEIYTYDPASVVRMGVAQNPNTPAELLDILKDDEWTNVKEAVIDNPNISTKTLFELLKARPWADNVLNAIYQRSKTDLNSIFALDLEIKRYFAICSHDAELLSIFAADPDPEVRKYVANNSSCSTTTYNNLANDPDDDVRRNLAANWYLPYSILLKLAKDRSWLVRIQVGRNSTTPMSILEVLARDEDEYVRNDVICSTRYIEAHS